MQETDFIKPTSFFQVTAPKTMNKMTLRVSNRGLGPSSWRVQLKGLVFGGENTRPHSRWSHRWECPGFDHFDPKKQWQSAVEFVFGSSHLKIKQRKSTALNSKPVTCSVRFGFDSENGTNKKWNHPISRERERERDFSHSIFQPREKRHAATTQPFHMQHWRTSAWLSFKKSKICEK